jgi:hypothetical protein
MNNEHPGRNMSKAEKDFWIEMSIREIWTQSHFAEIAFNNINTKAPTGTDPVFSSIHSFLSHCANVSKLLKATDKGPSKRIGDFRLREIYKNPGCFFSAIYSTLVNDKGPPPKSIGDILSVPDSSLIHKRQFRNNLEHYEARLKEWISRYGPNASVGTYNVLPKSMLPRQVIPISNYNPTTSTFTFVNRDFDLRVLYEEACRIKGIADTWVKEMNQGKITPPFG